MAAYRATVHDSIGFRPNRLFLGCEVRMPIDMSMGLPLSVSICNTSVDDFLTKQRERVEKAYRLAREHLRNAAQRHKLAYDTRESRSLTFLWAISYGTTTRGGIHNVRPNCNNVMLALTS